MEGEKPSAYCLVSAPEPERLNQEGMSTRGDEVSDGDEISLNIEVGFTSAAQERSLG